MPGLLGMAGGSGGSAGRQRYARARDRLLRIGRGSVREWSACAEAAVAARVRLEAEPDGRQAPAVLDAPRVVFYGALYNQDELIRQAERERLPGQWPDAPSATERIDALLSALYCHEGERFVSRLEGEFALLVIDPVRQRLLAATDLAGNYPLFWKRVPDGVVVATHPSAVIAADPGGTVLDLRAVADYLTCGMVLGDKTLAAGVHALDAGALLLHDVRQSRTTTASWCNPASLFAPKAANRDEYLTSVADTFARAVDRALDGCAHPGLSLSGGLDSRAILSAANGRAGRLTTYTLGVAGCADQVIGDRLARVAGTKHRFFPLDARYLRDFLPSMAEMVELTGGLYLSHGLTEMLAIRFLDEMGVSMLLRGHGGELAKAHLAWPLQTDAHIHGLQGTEPLVDYLARRVNYLTPSLPLARILAPDAAAAAGGGARESFQESLRATTLHPADCCGYLYLREHHRRFTVPSLELFRTKVEVRLPFMDPAFLRVLLASPPAWRESTAIHRRITASGIPALAAVRDSNTGAPASAGPAATFVLDKVNSVLKRFNVPGYRHYHNFDGWMRRSLLDSVEGELLAPGARVQAFVPRPTLAALLQETRSGAADRSYLLQVLLILELWQREHGVSEAA